MRTLVVLLKALVMAGRGHPLRRHHLANPSPRSPHPDHSSALDGVRRGRAHGRGCRPWFPACFGLFAVRGALSLGAHFPDPEVLITGGPFSIRPTRTPMMAITTSTSISVKPARANPDHGLKLPRTVP